MSRIEMAFRLFSLRQQQYRRRSYRHYSFSEASRKIPLSIVIQREPRNVFNSKYSWLRLNQIACSLLRSCPRLKTQNLFRDGFSMNTAPFWPQEILKRPSWSRAQAWLDLQCTPAGGFYSSAGSTGLQTYMTYDDVNLLKFTKNYGEKLIWIHFAAFRR